MVRGCGISRSGCRPAQAARWAGIAREQSDRSAPEQGQRVEIGAASQQSPMQTRPTCAAVRTRTAQAPDHLTRAHPIASSNGWLDGFVGCPQHSMGHRHDRQARHQAGEGDDASSARTDLLPESRRQIDAAVARGPWLRRRLKGAQNHGLWIQRPHPLGGGMRVCRGSRSNDRTEHEQQDAQAQPDVRTTTHGIQTVAVRMSMTGRLATCGKWPVETCPCGSATFARRSCPEPARPGNRC